MTSIIAVDMVFHIIVIADCRVTWIYPPKRKSYRLQDNLQKLYQFGPTGVVGFAGDIKTAKRLFTHFVQQPEIPLPPSAWRIADELSNRAREAYNQIPPNRREYIELLFAAVNYGNVSFRAENATLAEIILVELTPPDFLPIKKSNFVRLGSSKKLGSQEILKTRKEIVQFGLNPIGQRFQTSIAIGKFGDQVANIDPTTVGGLFTASVISAEGVTWTSYTHDHNYEIRFENNSFVQYDKSTGREISLNWITEFDAINPDPNNLRLDVPR